MSHTLPHGEAWLLELAVRYWLPICGLNRSNDDLHRWLLRGGHGLSKDDLHQTLRRLFDAGDICATVDEIDAPSFNPTDEQLDAALAGRDGHRMLRYGMTLQGGARWEFLAKPNWDRFFDRDTVYGERTTQIFAGSRDRLVELIEASEIIWNIRVLDPQPKIEVLEPWNDATAWKPLPRGYRTIVPFEDTAPKFDRREQYVSLVRWCSSLLGHVWV